MAVRVRTLEVKGRKNVPHKEGMTVGQALEGTEVKAGSTVTVNGQPRADLNSPVPDNALVVVTPNVDNG